MAYVDPCSNGLDHDIMSAYHAARPPWWNKFRSTGILKQAAPKSMAGVSGDSTHRVTPARCPTRQHPPARGLKELHG